MKRNFQIPGNGWRRILFLLPALLHLLVVVAQCWNFRENPTFESGLVLCIWILTWVIVGWFCDRCLVTNFSRDFY